MAKASPFTDVHKQLGARFEMYDGWSLPADFGNPPQERQALEESCAIVDLSNFQRFMLKGDSVRQAFNSIFTVKSGILVLNRWIWARADIQGEPIVFRAAQMNGDCLLLTQPGQGERVCRFIQDASEGAIEATDITDKTAMLGLYGPHSFDSVKGLLPFNIDDMEPGDAARVSVFMMSFTLLRGSWLAQEGLELICPAATGPMAAGAVAKYRHKKNITPAGMDSLSQAMQQVRWPV